MIRPGKLRLIRTITMTGKFSGRRWLERVQIPAQEGVEELAGVGVPMLGKELVAGHCG